MKRIIIAGVIALPLVLAACSNAPQHDNTSPVQQKAVDAKVEFQGKPRYLMVTNVTERRSDPTLAVFVEFTNTDNDDRQGYYRVRWLDSDGLPVWDEEPWKTLLLHGNQKEVVKMVAPTNKARDYKIQFNATDNWRN